MQAARIEEVERDKRRWQSAFRRLSTSLQSTQQQQQRWNNQADGETAEASMPVDRNNNQPLDAIHETEEVHNRGTAEAGTCSEYLRQSRSSESSGSAAGVDEDEDEDQQAAVIVKLIADQQERENRLRQLHDRLYGTLSEALLSGCPEGERAIRASSSAIDVSPAQLEQTWSVHSIPASTAAELRCCTPLTPCCPVFLCSALP